MARVLGLKSLEDKVRVVLTEKLADRDLLTKLGQFAVERIFNTTKLGFSMAGGEKHKLKPLSEGYRRYRAKYQAVHPVGSFFSPSRSNLTFTGQMLDALTFKINQSKRLFEVFVKDSARDPVMPISLRKQKEPPRMSNAEVAAEVADNGRPFIGLDTQATNRMRNEIIKDLRRKLRRSGLRK